MSQFTWADSAKITIGRGNRRLITGCQLLSSIWNETVRQFNSQREIEIEAEFLPLGIWPKRSGVQHCLEKEQNQNYYRCNMILPDRYDFLRSLKPSLEIIGIAGLGRHYRAFIVKNIALVESDRNGNAIYVYNASSKAWIKDAQKTKNEHRVSPPGSFIRKITHHGDWRKRVLKLF